jgi:hypothetical protein
VPQGLGRVPQEPGPEQEQALLGLGPLGPALLVRRPGCFQEQRRAFGARNLRKGLLRQVGE